MRCARHSSTSSSHRTTHKMPARSLDSPLRRQSATHNQRMTASVVRCCARKAHTHCISGRDSPLHKEQARMQSPETGTDDVQATFHNLQRLMRACQERNALVMNPERRT